MYTQEPKPGSKSVKIDKDIDEMTERIAKSGEKPVVAAPTIPGKRKYTRRPKVALQAREKKAVRHTTVMKSAETFQRLKERETKGKRRFRRFVASPSLVCLFIY